jgi:hypothetical protein
MNDLLQNIQRAAQASPAAPPARPAARRAAPPESTMLLSDESPDLGATVVDSPPTSSAPASTMLLSPDSGGFGQMRPIARAPQQTLPFAHDSFPAAEPGAPLDGTMMLPDAVARHDGPNVVEATMMLPGAQQTGAPARSFAPRPATMAPPFGPPVAQPWAPPLPPPSQPLAPPSGFSTLPIPKDIAPEPEPRDPEATSRLLVVGGFALVFLIVVGVVVKLTVFG